MKTKEKKDLHTKSQAELKTLLKSAREALSAAKLEKTQNKLKNTSLITVKKREIAQILTILKEKEVSAK